MCRRQNDKRDRAVVATLVRGDDQLVVILTLSVVG